jgi:iron complex transport system ATP-binding protein
VLLEAVDLHFGYDRRDAGIRLRRRPAITDPGVVPPRDRGVINGVSLTVRPGAITGILGPNGSGKTTLLKLLSGGLRPVSGVVRLDGRPLTSFSRRDVARRMAVVPQDTHLAFEYTALEIVLMGRYPWMGAFEVEGPDDIAAALDALESTGTRDLASRSFLTLSGGERQRVIIASVLAQLDTRRPAPPDGGRAAGAGTSSRPILFLDEPTTSLDLRYQLEIAALVRELHDTRGISVVLSTHDLRLASTLCSEVILLSRGRVLAQGSPDEMLTPALVGTLYEIGADVAAPILSHG